MDPLQYANAVLNFGKLRFAPGTHAEAIGYDARVGPFGCHINHCPNQGDGLAC